MRTRLEWSGFIASVMFAGYYFYTHIFGSWDGSQIWNFHAGLLLAGDIPKLWASTNAHPDYPLLLPAIIADLWGVFGQADWAPKVIAIAFASATTVLLAFESRIAAAILLFTPIFLRVTSWEGADVPIAFFFLATLVALKYEKFLIAGVMCGLATWTKNEGLLFALVVMAVVLWRHPRWVSELLATLFPFLAVALWVRHIMPDNDVIGPLTTLQVVTIWPRYWLIAKSFGLELIRDFWFPLLAVIALRRHPSPTPAIIISGVTLGYIAVYIITPQPLQWHLDSSLNRLLVQLLPSLLFAYGSKAMQSITVNCAATAVTATV
jgi:hypothetical protein